MPTIPPRLPRRTPLPTPTGPPVPAVAPAPAETPVAPARDRGALLSRRQILVGAAGIVAVGGGLAAVYATRRTGGNATGSTEAEAAAAATTAPDSTAPDSTAPATTAPDATAAGTTAPATATPATGRVLVVVQLSGGNDALNTVVPLTGAYHDARPTLGLPDDTLVGLPFTGEYGLHPALAPLGSLLAAGQVGIVAGVGFATPTRSHFGALDMWWAGRTEPSSDGWLGRWLDLTAPADPAVFRATGLGGAVPALGAATARSIGVTEIDRFSMDATGAPLAVIDAWAAMSEVNRDARAAADVLTVLAATSTTDPSTGNATAADPASATSLLAVAARLVAEEPGVEVIHVVVPGFDTHADQIASHQALLADVAGGIAGFQSAIAASGDAERVLLITTSEFGRRVAQNGSGGTDHGKAGAQLVIGAGLTTPGLHGAFDLTDLDEGDLRAVIDPRSLYATALDWLGGEADSARTDEVLGGAFERLPFTR